MKTEIFRGVAVLGLALAVGGCQDLTVTNTNNPDREQVLADPLDVEALIGTTWRPYWDYTQGFSANTWAISAMADEFTATFANVGTLDLSSEPRTAFNNDPTYDARFVAQGPWYAWYAGLSSGNDALRAMQRRNLVIRDAQGVDQTARSRAFAKFTQGLLLGYYALYYDQAFITKEDLDLADPAVVSSLKLQPYPEVRDAAIASLQEAIAIATANQFTLPTNWINGLALTNVELAQLANSYIARLHAYTARTPAERAAVNWNAVITHVDRGITATHAPIGEIGVLQSQYKLRAQSATTFQMRADYRLVGPADQSGNYQKWLNTPVNQRTRFLITTPDRRITGATPTTNGSYFRYWSTDGGFDASRGTYHFSAYQWRTRLNGVWNDGPLPIMYKAEMDLLKAEALIRLNRPAEAVPLINRSRTATQTITSGATSTTFPGLAPVTVTGTSGATCVPRKPSGACGDLFDALMYEKLIEQAGSEALLNWFDSRGWGSLTPGTPLHFPVPGRELITLGLPVYTTGGTNPGSAP
ncbi:hypothetical protein BH24GEM2_BH24GEM2_04070 [soil metagenome]